MKKLERLCIGVISCQLVKDLQTVPSCSLDIFANDSMQCDLVQWKILLKDRTGFKDAG